MTLAVVVQEERDLGLSEVCICDRDLNDSCHGDQQAWLSLDVKKERRKSITSNVTHPGVSMCTIGPRTRSASFRQSTSSMEKSCQHADTERNIDIPATVVIPLPTGTEVVG